MRLLESVERATLVRQCGAELVLGAIVAVRPSAASEKVWVFARVQRKVFGLMNVAVQAENSCLARVRERDC